MVFSYLSVSDFDSGKSTIVHSKVYDMSFLRSVDINDSIPTANDFLYNLCTVKSGIRKTQDFFSCLVSMKIEPRVTFVYTLNLSLERQMGVIVTP
uniref:P-loop containing nucleoside triphosphate hydrolase n=1 Tax=Heterorhabditis bacteriophora TaxID=37862 RepID=A0A1I7WPS3_HETBA